MKTVVMWPCGEESVEDMISSNKVMAEFKGGKVPIGWCRPLTEEELKIYSPGDTITFSEVPQELRDCNDEDKFNVSFLLLCLASAVLIAGWIIYILCNS